MTQKTHTDRKYEQQLKQVREGLLMMAGRVEQMIALSVQALLEQDVELAKQTIEEDHKVNRLEVETDELCLLILAKRQPMASDLRFITLALKMVTDLERIGDLAVNISERAFDMAEYPTLTAAKDILAMSSIVRTMVREAIDAFVEADEEKARSVIQRDDEVDQLYVTIFRDVLAMMVDDAAFIERGIHVQSVAKWLERIADHSTNLAELVVFMIKGKDIRHIGKRD